MPLGRLPSRDGGKPSVVSFTDFWFLIAVVLGLLPQLIAFVGWLRTILVN